MRERWRDGGVVQDRRPVAALRVVTWRREKAWAGVCALICGVTVVRDVTKVRKQNTEKEFVMHRPTLKKYQLPLDQRLLEFGIGCVRTTP